MHKRTALAASAPEQRTARWMRREQSGFLSFLMSRGVTVTTSPTPAHDRDGHRIIGTYTPTPTGHHVTVYGDTTEEDHETVVMAAAHLIDEAATAPTVIARPLDDYLPAATFDFGGVTPEMITGGVA